MSPINRMRTVLRHMVSLKRPYGSPEEGSIPLYLSGMFQEYSQWIDGAGNLHIDCRKDTSHRTLFVGHVDTVHSQGGPNQYREDSAGLYAMGVPLGADDAAGVAILAAMIGTVPGYYVFTRGEECGGVGSTYIAKNYPDLLRQFDRAIAFDRKGDSDVITHQAGGTCASDAFAWALADQLNVRGLMYVPSDGGIYTDTAEFTHLIPECTNISAGYYSEHTAKEWLDIHHHEALCKAALKIRWDNLPTRRELPPKWKPARVTQVSSWDELDDDLDGFPQAESASDACIEEAVWDALNGKYGDLLNLLASNIHPSEPDKARRQLDMHYLQADHIRDACRDSADWEMVIETLATNAFVPL